MPIKPVNIEELTSKAKNVHEAIVAMSKRARQINEETKLEFNQRIEMFVSKTESEMLAVIAIAKALIEFLFVSYQIVDVRQIVVAQSA